MDLLHFVVDEYLYCIFLSTVQQNTTKIISFHHLGYWVLCCRIMVYVLSTVHGDPLLWQSYKDRFLISCSAPLCYNASVPSSLSHRQEIPCYRPRDCLFKSSSTVRSFHFSVKIVGVVLAVMLLNVAELDSVTCSSLLQVHTG